VLFIVHAAVMSNANPDGKLLGPYQT
jgi:hypothetical protein